MRSCEIYSGDSLISISDCRLICENVISASKIPNVYACVRSIMDSCQKTKKGSLVSGWTCEERHPYMFKNKSFLQVSIPYIDSLASIVNIL